MRAAEIMSVRMMYQDGDTVYGLFGIEVRCNETVRGAVARAFGVAPSEVTSVRWYSTKLTFPEGATFADVEGLGDDDLLSATLSTIPPNSTVTHKMGCFMCGMLNCTECEGGSAADGVSTGDLRTLTDMSESALIGVTVRSNNGDDAIRQLSVRPSQTFRVEPQLQDCTTAG